MGNMKPLTSFSVAVLLLGCSQAPVAQRREVGSIVRFDVKSGTEAKSARMYIDWVTWGIWALGLALLLYWCVQTLRELRSLFSRKRGL